MSTKYVDMNYEEVVAEYYSQVELYLFQYGVKPQEMPKVMKAILPSAIQKVVGISDPSAFENGLLREVHSYLEVSALENVLLSEKDELEDLEGKRLFHFEDDEELHRKIGRLEPGDKVPLILHYFHDKDEGDISAITALTVEDISASITKATTQLAEMLHLETETQVVKQLEFLKKSYSRIRNLSDMEETLASDSGGSAVESNDQSIEKKKTDRFSIWKPVLLMSVILVFFGSIIFVSESYGKVDDRYLSKIEKDYEKKKEEQMETLQIKKEIYSQLFYVQQADQQFTTTMLRLKRKLEKGEELKREDIKEDYKEILEAIAIPSEMAKGLIDNPLNTDQSKSNAFFLQYMQRLDEIKSAYSQTIFDSNVPWNEQAEKRPEVPDNVKKAMEKQNLHFLDSENNYFPSYLSNEVTEKMKESVHPSSIPYFLIIEKADFVNYVQNDFNQEALLSTLRQFEEGFMGTERNLELYSYLSSVYSGAVMWLVNDSWRNPEDKIFDYQGVVKENYRELWKAFAASGDHSPLSVLFQPIVEEMEQNDWTFSQKQQYFSYEYIERAITLAREGRLDEFSYETTSVYQQFPMDFYQTEVSLENGSYLTSLEMTYKDFKQHPEPRNYGGNDPLQFLGLYEMARADGNVGAVYNLSYNTMSFNDFADRWKPGKSLFDGVESIKFDASAAVDRPDGRREIPIVFMVDGKEEIRAKMVFFDYYWLVSEIRN